VIVIPSKNGDPEGGRSNKDHHSTIARSELPVITLSFMNGIPHREKETLQTVIRLPAAGWL
jgi:hypothetical protein